MSKENVALFEDLLRDSEEMQAKLNGLAAAFEGNKGEDQAFFEATIGRLAKEARLSFTFEEGRETLFAARELDDDELDAVAGGTGGCYIIGGSDGPEATCGKADFHACAYVGITFPDVS